MAQQKKLLACVTHHILYKKIASFINEANE
ncbi:hypothetical protein CTB91_04100 [Dickeya solani]|nr:hypothetical protein CTB91_04100 [Dickeya solani]AYQ53986.1 hypothetical protein DSOL99_04098 [Dickeya solani]NUA54294.1 hypothetical protein [Dickeya solani]QKO07332.1 hypothetical protein HAT87_04080 [Dickeya solani]QKO11483.1 hypothetical protein HAT89_04085 [Dickeya solani]